MVDKKGIKAREKKDISNLIDESEDDESIFEDEKLFIERASYSSDNVSYTVFFRVRGGYERHPTMFDLNETDEGCFLREREMVNGYGYLEKNREKLEGRCRRNNSIKLVKRVLRHAIKIIQKYKPKKMNSIPIEYIFYPQNKKITYYFGIDDLQRLLKSSHSRD